MSMITSSARGLTCATASANVIRTSPDGHFKPCSSAHVKSWTCANAASMTQWGLRGAPMEAQESGSLDVCRVCPNQQYVGHVDDKFWQAVALALVLDTPIRALWEEWVGNVAKTIGLTGYVQDQLLIWCCSEVGAMHNLTCTLLASWCGLMLDDRPCGFCEFGRPDSMPHHPALCLYAFTLCMH